MKSVYIDGIEYSELEALRKYLAYKNPTDISKLRVKLSAEGINLHGYGETMKITFAEHSKDTEISI